MPDQKKSRREFFGASAGITAAMASVLADPPHGAPEVILIATGSEVSLAMTAHDSLAKSGVRSRVVSMPSWELFDAQDEAWRESVLPRNIDARVSIEAASTIGWERYVGRDGARIGMHSFGASAPAEDVYKKFGITVEAVERAARAQIERTRGNA